MKIRMIVVGKTREKYLREGEDEFKKRLNNFIMKAEQNKLIGFGGIDKYY